MTRLWLVRLGRYGEQEAHALASGELVTGFDATLTGPSRDAILEIYQKVSPDEPLARLRNWAGQINQFCNEAQIGDLVVLPLKTTRRIAIGKLTEGPRSSASGGDANSGSYLTRSVAWLCTDLPRDSFEQDLLYSFGSAMTVCEISRNDAVRRVEAVLAGKCDPKAGSGMVAVPASMPGSIDAPENMQDLSELARDQIERRLESAFAGHEFTHLIAALLQAEGFATRVSPPGPDRGVDIVAGRGALGLESPRLVVQVKSGDQQVDQPTLQALLGCIQDTRADQGLLVSWGGFRQTVTQRANDLYFRVRLWGRVEIVEAVFRHYPHLPETIRARLPLQQIWTLVTEVDVM